MMRSEACFAEVWFVPRHISLTLARIRCFAIFGRTGGVGATLPGVSKRSSWVNIWPSYGRSKVKFSEILWFFNFTSPYQQNYLSIYRRGMKPSTSVFPVQLCTEWGVLMHLGWIVHLGRIVLIDDAVSYQWPHMSDLWRHRSVTWHAHMIGISAMDT